MKHFKPDYERARPPKDRDRDHFRGNVVIETAATEPPEDVEVSAVWFESGSRTIPHSHPTEQLLLVVQGQCVVATRDRRVVLSAGECAVISKDEWHWHGAADTKLAMHISIKRRGEGNWNEPLYDFEEWTPGRPSSD